MYHLQNHIVADALHRGGEIIGFQYLVTLAVNHLPLIVGHVIVFQQILADIEVTPFYLALGILDGAGHPTVLDGLAVFQAQRTHHAADTIRSEDTHQIIFHGQEETGVARIPLTARTTTQLVINAAGFVTLGTDDVQASGFHDLVMVGLPLGADLLRLRL